MVSVTASTANPNEPCNYTPPSTTPNNPPCQLLNSYQLLAPLPCPEGFDDCILTPDGKAVLRDFNPTKDSSLGSYLNVMIKIIIGLAAVLSVIMIIVGGLEYMTSELISSKEEGRKKITGALLGLLIALGAYALLNTINPDLLSTDINIDQATITVDLEADVPQTPVNGRYANGATFGNPWNDTVGALTTLPQFVTISNSQCVTIGQTNCTSTRRLDISALQAIQYGCKCVLTVTGGTESWLHGGKSGSTSHQLGSSTVDLRPSPELNRYLLGGQPLIKLKRYSSPVGSVLFEGNHWHIGP